MPPDSTYINSDSLREIAISQQEVISKLTETINQVTLNEKLFGLFSYDTVFTVAITLSIFILGILIDRCIKHYEKREDRKELRLFFKTFLDISYQYNYLKRLVIEFKLDYRKFYNYTVDSKEKLNMEREKITWR